MQNGRTRPICPARKEIPRKTAAKRAAIQTRVTRAFLLSGGWKAGDPVGDGLRPGQGDGRRRRRRAGSSNSPRACPGRQCGSPVRGRTYAGSVPVAQRKRP